mmetsp:Transcript_29686/g.114256  ORF Transcript_29686/g.114256 Transcript_29686/m.114256 type:complete len:84 (-) Transcript_29686:222-473(-)
MSVGRGCSGLSPGCYTSGGDAEIDREWKYAKNEKALFGSDEECFFELEMQSKKGFVCVRPRRAGENAFFGLIHRVVSENTEKG